MNTKNTRKQPSMSPSTEVSGRGPLTRSKKALLNQATEAHSSVNSSLNGSYDEENATHDSDLYPEIPGNERGEGPHVRAQKLPKKLNAHGDQEIRPNTGSSSVLPKKAAKPPEHSSGDVLQTTSLRSFQKVQVLPATSVAENRGTVNDFNLVSSAERPVVIDEFVNDLRSRSLVRPTIRSRPTAHQKNEERTSTSNKRCTESSSRSFFWNVTSWILLFICTAVLSFLILSVLSSSDDGKIILSRPVKVEQFHELFTTLESSFPNQRDQLWHMSKIHLQNHLKTQDPPEPVSLIFAAGLGAEKTLRCLALRVASSFSSAYNASVLSIDGTDQAGFDGDRVKLYIDNQLQAAFEGEKPAAVIHRLEELPPSSTLIFYRYCDHENAAYKKVFLLFTVLLPRDEITSDQSLKEVEELVQDHLLQKLVEKSSAGFNKMDANKFSGLWSRISHVILPVVSEEQMEKKGCEL